MNKVYRLRLLLFTSIILVALLGGVANWAEPKIDAWLFPPPPLPPAICTSVSVPISNSFSSQNTNNARKWVGEPDITMTGWGFIFSNERDRWEYWITDGIVGWQIEIVCFDDTPTHYIVYGEFHKVSFEEMGKELGLGA